MKIDDQMHAQVKVDFFAGGGRHLGIFEGCGTGLPFAAQEDGKIVPAGCC